MLKEKNVYMSVVTYENEQFSDVKKIEENYTWHDILTKIL